MPCAMVLTVPSFHVQTATGRQIKVPYSIVSIMLNHIKHPPCRVKAENSNLW